MKWLLKKEYEQIQGSFTMGLLPQSEPRVLWQPLVSHAYTVQPALAPCPTFPGPEPVSQVFATKSVQSRENSVHSPCPMPKSVIRVLLQQWMSSFTQQLGKFILSVQIFIWGTYGKCLHSWHFPVFTYLNKTPQWLPKMSHTKHTVGLTVNVTCNPSPLKQILNIH